MSRFDLAPYIVVAVWSAPFVLFVAAIILGALRDRREAREMFGDDGPGQRALLSLVREEARR